ncbi:hypothetical protein BDY24DRAFT_388256 [Mrakia frigida]|uniref:uncharacterized protein n=1 Tax=Mrakia frigida TaxID=29902 RepID=UPI003FCC2004
MPAPTPSPSATTLLVFSPSAHHLSPPPPLTEAHFAIQQSLASSLSASSSNEGHTITVPSLETLDPLPEAGLLASSQRPEFDVTVKLFLPPGAGDDSATSKKGRELVEKALGALGQLIGEEVRVDAFVVGWGDVEYDGEETDFSGKPKEVKPCGGLKLASKEESELGSGLHGLSDERLSSLVDFWNSLSSSPSLSKSSLGVTSFSLPLLKSFLSSLPPSSRRPTIDHLNLKDCCHIPQILSNYAREKEIRLISSSDVGQPITKGAIAELLGPYQQSGELPASSVELDWTLKYTILHKTRGLVIDKGYILSASFSA